MVRVTTKRLMVMGVEEGHDGGATLRASSCRFLPTIIISEMKKLNVANSEKLSQLSRSVNSSKMNILRFLNPLGLSKYVLQRVLQPPFLFFPGILYSHVPIDHGL